MLLPWPFGEPFAMLLPWPFGEPWRCLSAAGARSGRRVRCGAGSLVSRGGDGLLAARSGRLLSGRGGCLVARSSQHQRHEQGRSPPPHAGTGSVVGHDVSSVLM